MQPHMGRNYAGSIAVLLIDLLSVKDNECMMQSLNGKKFTIRWPNILHSDDRASRQSWDTPELIMFHQCPKLKKGTEKYTF